MVFNVILALSLQTFFFQIVLFPMNVLCFICLVSLGSKYNEKFILSSTAFWWYAIWNVAFLSRWTKWTINSQLEGFLFFFIYSLQCYLSLMCDASLFKIFEVTDVEEDLCWRWLMTLNVFFIFSDSNKRTSLVNLGLQYLVHGYKKIGIPAYTIVGLKKPTWCLTDLAWLYP